MTYFVGLALLVLGGGLITVPFVGLVGIVLIIYGAALILRAVERLEGAPVGSLRSLLGGLLLVIGLLGAIALAFGCGAIATWRARGMPWDYYLRIGSVCAVWPGVICAGAWMRRRPAWATVRFLWLSLAATYLAICAAGLGCLSWASNPRPHVFASPEEETRRSCLATRSVSGSRCPATACCPDRSSPSRARRASAVRSSSWGRDADNPYVDAIRPFAGLCRVAACPWQDFATLAQSRDRRTCY
jgi:hypothetical protein